MVRAAAVLLHRYVGLALAGFLVVAGLTGSVLSFQAELDAWLNPEFFDAVPTGRLLSPSQVAAAVAAEDPRVVATYIIPAERPTKSTTVFVRAKSRNDVLEYDHMFVDPGTGEVRGKRLFSAVRIDRQHIIPFLYRLHYSLHLPVVTGMWFMGFVAIAWMVDSFVGFYLTLPRGRPFLQKWRPAWMVKRGGGTYRLNLDLHRAIGLWLWPVMFVMALSSLSLNLNREVFRPVLSALLPVTQTALDLPPPSPAPPMVLDYDAATERAQAEAARRGWEKPVAMIHMIPARGLYRIRFGREHEAGFGASTIFVSGTDGQILNVVEAGAGQAGDVVQDLMFPLHSGQVAGLPGRIFICLTGIAVATVSITGVVIWWKKRAGRVARRRQAKGVQPALARR